VTGERPVTEATLDAWLVFALACCDAADAMALEHFRRDLVIETKPDRTFVTQADTAIERTIRGLISGAYPDHGLVGEEYGTEAGTGTVRWYIDPIDGTHNFMRGVPLFGTLLAVEADGELVVGVMSAPALGERWYARRGGGAWAVGSTGPGAGSPRRIGASRVGSIADSPEKALELLDRYDRPGTLFYLDPPYWGSEADYGPGVFCRSDFERLAEKLAGLKGHFVMSLNDHSYQSP